MVEIVYIIGKKPWNTISKAAISAANTVPPAVSNNGDAHSFRSNFLLMMLGLIPDAVNIVTPVDKAKINRHSILPVNAKISVVAVTKIKLPDIISAAALILFFISSLLLFCINSIVSELRDIKRINCAIFLT